MAKKIIHLFIFLLLCSTAGAQVKIGDSLQPAHPDAYLQLGDTKGSKGFLLPRIALTSTQSPAPLSVHVAGMQVYNTATANDVNPGMYYNDGNRWIRVAVSSIGNFVSYSDSLVIFITPTEMQQALSAYMKTSDTAAMLAPYLNKADNGLSVAGKTVELGGVLKKPTAIVSSATNTFAIQGLASGSLNDSLISIDPQTGVLRKISSAALGVLMLKSTTLATEGQTTFNTPLAIASLDKLQVFRNGAQVEFTATVGSSQLMLLLDSDTNGGCLKGDEIKIFQWK